MTIKVTDNRHKIISAYARGVGLPLERQSSQAGGVPLSGIEDEMPTVPPWWQELVAVDAELHSATRKHGAPESQGADLALFGNPYFRNQADWYKAVNDKRAALGKPGHWLDITLEEVFEALAEPATEENAANLYHELIQAAAMCAATAEVVRATFASLRS